MRGIERLAAVNRSTPPMAEALPNLPMPETVMVRLIRIGVVGLGQFFEPVFRQIGLTETSFHVLCLLMASERGEASPSELSELVGTSRANMTRILDGLASDRLVSRNVEERDGASANSSPHSGGAAECFGRRAPARGTLATRVFWIERGGVLPARPPAAQGHQILRSGRVAIAGQRLK